MRVDMRGLLYVVFTSFLLTAIHQHAFAAEFYVDADGGDDANSGSIRFPWKTIAKVKSSAKANDTVYFQRGDTWKERLDIPASNMVFDAYGTGAKPTLDGENIREHAFHIVGKHDIVIKNFNIINVTLCGIQFSTFNENITYNLTITNNDFVNMGSMGVRTYVPHDVQLTGYLPYGVTIQGNTFTDLGNFAIGLNVTDIAPNLISENIIIRSGNGNNQTNAIQLGAKGLIVEKNVILDTRGGPNGDGHAIIIDWGAAGYLETASENVTVRHNYVAGANFAKGQSGIHVWQGKNNIIYGNISVNNSIGYKISNAASTGNVFYNNVAYNNIKSGAYITTTAPLSTWQNNIFYGINNYDAGIASYGVPPVESNNIFYNVAIPYRVSGETAAAMDPSDLVADPLFNDPQANDFSLQRGSPAIQLGADLTGILSGLVTPGSIWPDNVALIDKPGDDAWEKGAYAFGDNVPNLPILMSPVNNESRLGSTVDLIWKQSPGTQPEAEVAVYRITYCTDKSFTDCQPAGSITLNTFDVFHTSSLGFLIIGMTLFGGLAKRRNLVPVFIGIILIESVLLQSCEKVSESDATASEIHYTVSDLAPGTTYHWKVEAENLQGKAVNSAVWSFSTH